MTEQKRTKRLARVDRDLCAACGVCMKVCPKKAIVAVNFPAPKPTPAAEERKEEQA